MKLSSNTTNILKNFSQINQSILIKQGNKLKTISVMKNILAEAEIEEEFEKDFAIYDLNQFLSGLSLYDSPDLDFGESYLTIRDGRRRAKYFFADPDVIVSPPEKEISLPTRDVCFTVATQQLDKLLKAAAIYQVPDLSAIGRNGKVELVVRDKKYVQSAHVVLHTPQRPPTISPPPTNTTRSLPYPLWCSFGVRA